jgi:hypothetical protein
LRDESRITFGVAKVNWDTLTISIDYGEFGILNPQVETFLTKLLITYHGKISSIGKSPNLS